MSEDCSCNKSSLWTKEMFFLSLSNFLLYLSIYVLLPVLPLWISSQYGCSIVESAAIVSLYGISAFFTGPFNSYLIDAFKRRNVGLWGLVFIGLSSLCFPYASLLIYVLILRLAQGSLLGVVTMSTGSTLLIDVTPSNCRTKASVWYTRIGRVGMCFGLFIGVMMSVYYNFDYITYVSSLSAIIGALLLLTIEVPFRAPLKPSLCSLDRFLLPRSFPVAVNLLFVTFVFGLMIPYIVDAYVYLYLIAGFVISFVLYKFLLKHVSKRIIIFIGTLLLIFSMVLKFAAVDNVMNIVSSICFGMGLSLTTIIFYIMIINLPLHCERGSANNTYFLIWELGLSLGFLSGYLLIDTDISYVVSLALAVLTVSTFYYELIIRKWYNRKKLN